MASYEYSGILPMAVALELVRFCLLASMGNIANTVNMDDIIGTGKEFLFGDGIFKNSVTVTTYKYKDEMLRNRHAAESPVRLEIHIQNEAMAKLVNDRIFQQLRPLRNRGGVRWAFWEPG